jgi:hypothetical protein
MAVRQVRGPPIAGIAAACPGALGVDEVTMGHNAAAPASSCRGRHTAVTREGACCACGEEPHVLRSHPLASRQVRIAPRPSACGRPRPRRPAHVRPGRAV